MTSRKAPKVGSGPCTVSVMVAVAVEKSPVAACDAVIVVVPNAKGVTVFDTTEATLGLEEVNIQLPGEVDFGGLRLRLPTLSFITVTSPKLPSTGVTKSTVNRIRILFAFQFGVLVWFA